jgi:PAS domain S-box-containing protein
MAGVTRILIVEDNPTDVTLMERQIRRVPMEFAIRRVVTERDFLQALDQFPPDLILSDHTLPEFTARDVLHIGRNRCPNVPIIVVTGSLGEETAAEYIKEGATDYIVKHHLERLGPAVMRALTLRHAQADQHRVQEELKASEGRLRAILDAALDSVVTIDGDGVVLGWSGKSESMFGWTTAEAEGRQLSDLIIPERFRERHREGMRRFLASGLGPILNRQIEMPALRRDGEEIPVEMAIVPIRLGTGWAFSAFIRDLSERRKAEAVLQAAQTRLAQVVSASVAVIYANQVIRNTFQPTWVSDNVERLTGYTVQEALAPGWWFENVHPDDQARAAEELAGALVRQVFTCEYRFRFRDGSYRWIRDEARLLLDADGSPVELIGTWIDTTERRNLESQLQHAQRLDAVGQLAGGIAHDFNNVLTAISGNADLLLEQLAPSDSRREDVEEIRSATLRAAALTRQLLAFSRRQVLQPQVLDLAKVLDKMERMLQRLIGEHIELVCELGAGQGDVEVDPSQIEQVLLNLIVNARDAIAGTGKITIATSNVTIDAAYARSHPSAISGEFVMLSVSDTGRGMTAEVRQRLFEPFFTTKEVGQGTGLGLATVYGIVKQSGGFIQVASEPGQGSTFRVYMPRVAKSGRRLSADAATDSACRGTETILLVEDEAAVRKVARGILEHYGYRVLEARLPVEALALAHSFSGTIEIVVTDVVMPGMNGPEMVQQLLEQRPGLKVLYASGYPGSTIEHPGVLTPDVGFLTKPFTATALAKKVRQILDAALA